MERRKKRAGGQQSKHRSSDCAENPVRRIEIQPHLLKQAKRHVAKKTIRNKEAVSRTVHGAKKNSYKAERDDTRQKDQRRALSSEPQIVGSPSEGLRSVAMHDETGKHPDGEHQPQRPGQRLKLPDVPSNVSGEGESFNQD